MIFRQKQLKSQPFPIKSPVTCPHSSVHFASQWKTLLLNVKVLLLYKMLWKVRIYGELFLTYFKRNREFKMVRTISNNMDLTNSLTSQAALHAASGWRDQFQFGVRPPEPNLQLELYSTSLNHKKQASSTHCLQLDSLILYTTQLYIESASHYYDTRLFLILHMDINLHASHGNFLSCLSKQTSIRSLKMVCIILDMTKHALRLSEYFFLRLITYFLASRFLALRERKEKGGGGGVKQNRILWNIFRNVNCVHSFHY